MSSMLGTGQSAGLKGTGYQQVQTPSLSPQQMQLFQQLLGGSQGGLNAGLGQLSQQAQGGNEDYWNKLEAPAKREFGELQGQIASRFSGASGSPGSRGAQSARRSSAFQNELGGQAANFAERLSSNRLGLQQSAIQQLLGLSQNLLGTNAYDTHLIPKKKPFWQELLGSAAGGIGQGVGYGLGTGIF